MFDPKCNCQACQVARSNKAFAVIKLKAGETIEMNGDYRGQLLPVRLYIFPHGDIKNKPSFAFELVAPGGAIFIMQISEKMLSTAFIEADAMKVLSEQ